MGYWGWRPLVLGLFVSTWIAGCNIATDNTAPSASPSAYPNVTLTVGRLPTARVSTAPTRAAPNRAPGRSSTSTPARYVVQPGDTLDEIAARFNLSPDVLRRANYDVSTLVPGQTLQIPAPTPMPLLVQPPTCYEARPGSLLCLGRVENPLAFPVEAVSVEVHLIQQNGEIYRSQRSTVEQTNIPSGSFAPYQAMFSADWSDFTTADAALISAAPAEADRFLTLLIEDVQGVAIGAQLIVTAVIVNPNAQTAELLRAFITLTDSAGAITGYRVVTFESGSLLAAGDRLPIEIEITPQADALNPAYFLYVEARAAEPDSTEAPTTVS